MVQETFKLRDYQEELSSKGVDILKKHNIIYYSLAVRTGKTAISLNTCKLFGSKKVLFLTKKKAISSIESDYYKFEFNNFFEIKIINNESLHYVEENDFDIIIMDEAHRLGSFPKPCKMAVDFKKRFSSKPIIFLSGTMSPENYSQIYHQFWVSDYSPFKEYKNFYKWAHDYVNITQKRIGAFMHNDYSGGIEYKIMNEVNHLILTLTQEQAGFSTQIDEEILYVEMKPITYKLSEKLFQDRIVEGKDEVILADTAAKLMQKQHQIFSGTIKFESGNSKILDDSKAVFIKERFNGSKLAIMYIFKEELNVLKSVFGDTLTTELDEFNNTDKHFAGQVVSSREGISLKKADYLIMYNIQHSAVSYWQARDRMTTMDRKENKVYFIFAKKGIELNVYKTVMSKKKYTVNVFKKDYGIK